MVSLNASVITMNPLRIRDEVDLLAGRSVEYLHLDIMDSIRVPRFGVYPEIVDALAEATDFKLDVHLMVRNPEFALSQIRQIARVETVSFHVTDDLENSLRTVDFIRKIGCRPIIAINLATPVAMIERLVRYGDVDGYNFLAIHPGVVVQDKRIEQMLNSIPEFLSVFQPSGSDVFHQCDGGVTFDSIPELVKLGVNNLVLGTGALYSNRDMTRADLDASVVMQNLVKICKLAEVRSNGV